MSDKKNNNQDSFSEKVQSWWNIHSQSYQNDTKIPIDIHYGPGSPNETKLRLLGSVVGKRVLELGCGGAQCSIAFAKQGATVTAIDISSEQLEFAKKLAHENAVIITFYCRDISDLAPIATNSQDIVFSAAALGYVDNLFSCFKEVYRVLDDGGLFVWSIGHPLYDLIDPQTMKIRHSYFETGKRVEGEETGSAFASVSRTISELFNTVVQAGFKVEQILEPDSRIKYSYDPWYGLWDYTPELLAKIPATLIFKCRK